MRKIKVTYLNNGWNNGRMFAKEVERQIDIHNKINYELLDIKICSNGNNTLLLFRRK